MTRPGSFLGLLRRDLQRGWEATRHYYFTLPRIEEWSWPFWGEKPQGVPLHVLTGAEDWRMAAWMIASWFHYSEHAWPIVIHDDGTLPKEARESLGKLFTGARFIGREEADAAMERVLKAFPFCYEYRGMHRFALKVFDIPHFAANERFMVFNPEVLFFSYPREILDWVDTKSEESWFMEDVRDNALITTKEAESELDVKLWSRVNTGIGLVYNPSMDFDFCDRALARTTIMRGQFSKIEQTLYALCASRRGKGGLLPPHYEVTLSKRSAEDAVARHYAEEARERFFGEGLRRLAPVLLAKA